MRRFLLILLLVPLLISCSQEEDDGRLKVTALNFPSYDAVRAVLAEEADLKMLIPPGADVHSWEPSPDDVIRILTSDLFIYVGGESDEWVDSLLDDLDGKVRVFSLLEHSPMVLDEETSEGMQSDEMTHEELFHHHAEADEHVWTSLTNMASIIEALKDEIISLDSANSESYEANAERYISAIFEIRDELLSTVKNAKRNLIIVADRFPFLYFVKELGLSYYAAFPGCASGTEPSARTVAFLIDKVKEMEIPAVLHIELSNTMLASLIADETGANVYEINSAQNISRRDFNAGRTYLDIMRDNAAVLKEVLN